MEDELGWVLESYKMVDQPTVANPSGKWTNFTDGSCKELIYVTDDMRLTARYLMKCDAVDCCHEEQDGNHVSRRAPGTRGCNPSLPHPHPHRHPTPTPHTQNDQDVRLQAAPSRSRPLANERN